MDFQHDLLATGQRFRTLNIVDDFSRECPAIEVDTSLPGVRVMRVLDRLAETLGLPREIVLDNGPEMIGKTLDEWAWRNGVRLNFIEPGKPTQDAFIESFNGCAAASLAPSEMNASTRTGSSPSTMPDTSGHVPGEMTTSAHRRNITNLDSHAK